MQKADSLWGSWHNVTPFLAASLVIVADQLSKMWVRSYLKGQLIHKMGFLQLVHVTNTGGVFGLFQGQSLTLTVVAIIEIVAILFYALLAYRRYPIVDSVLNRVAVGFILGGTVGNLIDRLRLGYVTDFVSIGIWPAFNIADSAVVVGTIIFALSLLRLTRSPEN